MATRCVVRPPGQSVPTVEGVPKSRGRKSEPGKKSRARPTSAGRGCYTPGVVSVDERQGMIGLANLGPDQLVEIGLPSWWLMLQHGNPANVCLDGALVLRTAYAQLGLTAVPKLVELVVDNPGSDHATGYGTATPHFTDDTFVGHMGLWLPQSRRSQLAAWATVDDTAGHHHLWMRGADEVQAQVVAAEPAYVGVPLPPEAASAWTHVLRGQGSLQPRVRTLLDLLKTVKHHATSTEQPQDHASAGLVQTASSRCGFL